VPGSLFSSYLLGTSGTEIFQGAETIKIGNIFLYNSAKILVLDTSHVLDESVVATVRSVSINCCKKLNFLVSQEFYLNGLWLTSLITLSMFISTIAFSNLLPVLSGVPQGSISGSLKEVSRVPYSL